MNNKYRNFWKIFVAGWVAVLLVSGTNLLRAQAINPEPSNGNGTSSDGIISLDTTEPADVENLTAQAGDGEVQLSWDASTDNVGVTGYKIYRGTRAVKSENDSYDLPVIPLGNVKTYTVKNLQNGQTYYFSATAVDAARNESSSYAREASAKPMAGLHLAAIEDDGKPPQVKKVKAEDVVSVTVEFSEPVKLPEEQSQSAFQIEKTSDKSRLDIQKAEIDSRDETGATVLLTTEPQEEGAEYVLTAGIEIQDYYNNPVISGTADTGSFKGSAKKKQDLPPPQPAHSPVAPQPSGSTDKDPPTVTGGSAATSDRMAVNFSEKVTLPENPRGKISIYKKGTQAKLNVLNVSLSVDGKTAYVTTDPQEPVEYEIRVAGFADEAGNEVAAKANSVTVMGKEGALKDLIPPEDVTKLVARIKNAEKNIVELRWEASKNSAEDLADQLLYQSEGKMTSTFGASTSLGTSTTAVEVEDLKAGKWHTFKVTAKDTSANESRGAVTAIYLPQTGPGVIVAGLTGLVMGWYRRRKSKIPK
ncbi:fibronectin type III domain-containing protein [Candidatus Peregrinibacteria bacterium]|nr:fibronectin type III domain-containing protein [Candidatus Peregrinibacteria bacterium]